MKTWKHWALVTLFVFDGFGCLYLFVERQTKRAEAGMSGFRMLPVERRSVALDRSDKFSRELSAHWEKSRPRGGYVRHVHDCDDFAIEYYGALRTAGYRAGYARSDTWAHAWNCVERPDNGGVLYIEPQNGRVYEEVPSDVIIYWKPEEIVWEWIYQTLLEGPLIKSELQEPI